MQDRSRGNIDYTMPFLLVLPMVTHWLFPVGIEEKFSIYTEGIYFYMPNVCYIMYILLRGKCFVSQTVCVFKNVWERISVLLLIILIYAIIQPLFINTRELFLSISCCLSYVFLTFIFLRYPLTPQQYENTKYIIIPVLLIICLEVFIFSLGIMQYETEMGTSIEGEQYAGIIRVSTTIGASTGTAIVIAILGIISTSLYKIDNWIKIVLFFLVTIALFYTMSRGSLLLWLGYSIFILYRFVRLQKKGKRWKFVVLYAIGGLLLSNYGVFNAILERNDELVANGMIQTNREEKRAIAWNSFVESGYVGWGIGQCYADKSVITLIKTEHNIASHNVYLTLLTEGGVVVCGCFVIMLFIMLKSLRLSHPASIGLLLVILITFNTEAVPLHAEFWSLFMLLFVLNLKNAAVRKSS